MDNDFSTFKMKN